MQGKDSVRKQVGEQAKGAPPPLAAPVRCLGPGWVLALPAHQAPDPAPGPRPHPAAGVLPAPGEELRPGAGALEAGE